MPSSRGSSQRNCISCISGIAAGFFTSEPPGKPNSPLAHLLLSRGPKIQFVGRRVTLGMSYVIAKLDQNVSWHSYLFTVSFLISIALPTLLVPMLYGFSRKTREQKVVEKQRTVRMIRQRANYMQWLMQKILSGTRYLKKRKKVH